jgi:hypothetical protein
MSWRNLERTFRRYPEWQEPVRKLATAVNEIPLGVGIRPSLLARKAELSPTLTVAILHAFQEAGLGELGLRVLDQQELEVRRFDSVDGLPGFVLDEMGDRVELSPENVEVFFARTADVWR